MHPNKDTSEAAVISIFNDEGKSFQELIEEYLKIVLTKTAEK